MGQVANNLFSESSGASTAHALYNASGDILGPANAYNIRAAGASVYPEVQDLTAGESTTKLGHIRFQRPTNSHIYGVCTSTRYVAGTNIGSASGVTNSNTTTTYTPTMYDMRFSSSTANNLRIDLNLNTVISSYSHTISAKVDGTTVASLSGTGTGQSTTFFTLTTHGTHTIQIVYNVSGFGASQNSCGWTVTIAE